MKTHQDALSHLFENWAGTAPDSIINLPQSGSARSYYRLSGSGKTAIGAINNDEAENQAFIYFTRHFLQKNLPVPSILGTDLNNQAYLLEDLGDQTLYQEINQQTSVFNEQTIQLYRQSLDHLSDFQIKGHEGFNYQYAYPRSDFDKQSVMWDLNYFKYHFLKLAGIPFDEAHLENDFNKLANRIDAIPRSFFMYRDFQSRNIMVHHDKLYFIDYQGGRRGAPGYDVASLLFESKTNLPPELREELLNYYLEQAENKYQLSKDSFLATFYDLVLVRLLQAFGAYGFRGLYEKKPLFIQSIPFGLNRISWLLKENKINTELSYLKKILKEMSENKNINKQTVQQTKLKIRLQSFSYKRGIPYDPTGNGGGFVFDCRGIINPGRYDAYKDKTGLDQEVIDFFHEHATNELNNFLSHAIEMIKPTILSYQNRGFLNLSISFGCTGGQHRSVFCTENFKEKLKAFDVDIETKHHELDLIKK